MNVKHYFLGGCRDGEEVHLETEGPIFIDVPVPTQLALATISQAAPEPVPPIVQRYRRSLPLRFGQDGATRVFWILEGCYDSHFQALVEFIDEAMDTRRRERIRRGCR